MILKSFYPFFIFVLSFLEVLFFLLIGGMILFKLFKNKIKNDVLDISEIKTLSKGLVNIKGKIKPINYIESPISERECIGYNYSNLSLSYDGRRGAKGVKRWRIYRTKSVSSDFYLQDKTGQIKVNAKNISIQINVNRSEKKLSRTLIDVENLLLEDGTEYILIGTVNVDKNGDMEIVKEKELIIMDEAFYKFVNVEIPSMKKKIRLFIIFLLLVLFIFIIHNFGLLK
ncbi:hypothetical protein [Cellulophaga baltica]|uniref:RING-type E3 ubiquitin transferase n=1 Tax=Cellulophaga baltica 18 TaxID=1348584 RepID=A0AAU8S0H1_9FLAO|nr:hypothetical protein [Cellulophaga baltica]AIZ42780.1 hypothetical protein M666_15085 [Cellulophaga baltica 18]